MGKRKLAYADSSQSKIQKLTTFGFSSNAGSNESSALQKDETAQNTKPSLIIRKCWIDYLIDMNIITEYK